MSRPAASAADLHEVMHRVVAPLLGLSPVERAAAVQRLVEVVEAATAGQPTTHVEEPDPRLAQVLVFDPTRRSR